jgi:hypothetical protein
MAQVFDGKRLIPVTTESNAEVKPIPPAPAGDGSIFVSVVTYRGMCVVSMILSICVFCQSTISVFNKNVPHIVLCC